ncbi:hypothetical protein L3Q82_013760 [Scortum barcoo]|uniref:Uncharacterized protein n=1 Tax=Scortum barcoo TaxID=214431 RepID=A0ACB8VVH5_9TELE|nr:hypothetical protein L3Q82_013760 [Scortum barcoo]
MSNEPRQEIYSSDRNAPGPDCESHSCLKVRADQLMAIFTKIFNRSLEPCEVPSCFKRPTIIPIPRKRSITGFNDYRNVSSSSSLPPPVLTVFPPSSAELQSNKASLVCLSSQSVPFADVSWLSGGSPVSSGISTSTAVQQADRTFQISSYLAIQTSDWNMDKVYTCKVSLGSQTSEKNINKSSCPTEE